MVKTFSITAESIKRIFPLIIPDLALNESTGEYIFFNYLFSIKISDGLKQYGCTYIYKYFQFE